jgi:Tfp pilus assembly protein FimT
MNAGLQGQHQKNSDARGDHMPQSMTPLTRSRGITVVEVLIVIAVFLILISFAIPSINVGTTKADLLNATEQFEYSVRLARNTARSTESEVTLQIQPATENDGAIIRFVTENTRDTALRQLAHQFEELNASVLVQSEHARYVFDERGMVREPGQVILAARDDSTLAEVLRIQ